MTTTPQRTAQQDAISGNLLGPAAPGDNYYLHHCFHYLPRRSSQNLGKSSKSQLPLADPFFVLGRAGGAAVHDSNGGVVLKASSSASSTLGQWIAPRAATKLATVKFGSLDLSVMELVFKAPAITTFQFQVGFVTSRVLDLTTDNYQAKFWFKSTTHATKLYAATSDNHAGTVDDDRESVGIDLAADTLYKLQIAFDAEGYAHFYGGEAQGDVRRLYTSARPITNAGAGVDLLPVVQWNATAKAAVRNLMPYSITLRRKLS